MRGQKTLVEQLGHRELRGVEVRQRWRASTLSFPAAASVAAAALARFWRVSQSAGHVSESAVGQ
jgi:hypothetical protein